MKAFRYARRLHTSGPRTHVSSQRSTYEDIREISKQIKTSIDKLNERETMPLGSDSSLTTTQLQYPGSKAGQRSRSKARPNMKHRDVSVVRQARPTTTEEYFRSMDWLNSVGELSFTFVAHNGKKSSFDHILMDHDRLERPILLPTLLMR